MKYDAAGDWKNNWTWHISFYTLKKKIQQVKNGVAYAKIHITKPQFVAFVLYQKWNLKSLSQSHLISTN